VEPVDYLRGVRRRWRVVVAAVLVGMSAAWLTSAAVPADETDDDVRFGASVLVLDARGPQFGLKGGSVEGVSLDTISVLATLEQVAERAATLLKSDVDPEVLAADVAATADSETGILTITATADRAKRAERLADAFARGLRDYIGDERRQSIRQQIKTLERQIEAIPAGESDGRGNDSSVRLALQSQVSGLQVDLAAPLGLPILERTTADEVEGTALTAPTSQMARLLIGAVVGVLGGLGLALVLERFDRKITTWRTAEQMLPYPLLAEVPRLRKRRSLAVVDRPTSRGADSFRLLASSVLHAIEQARSVPTEGNGHGAIPETPMLAITSAVRSEGKSLISANLAAALGELGRKIIVMSADLRSPTIHRYFEVPAVPGIVDAMASWDGQPGFRRVCRSTRAPGVSVIPGGSSSARPATVLANDDVQKLVRYARAECDILILDTPAILLSGDAAPLVQRADGVLLVTRVGKTSIDAADRVSETLERIGAPVIGFTLNGARGVGSGWGSSPYQVSKDRPSVEPTPALSGSQAWIGSGLKR
jgi:succinoglycan biosynthesis transport protein ExoP